MAITTNTTMNTTAHSYTIRQPRPNPVINALTTVAAFLRNKGILLLVFLGAFYGYHKLPEPGPDQAPLPFTEIAYTGLTLLALVVSATVLRMLVFGESAKYAETGGLDDDLEAKQFTPALVHYWISTIICYAIAAMCMASISK